MMRTIRSAALAAVMIVVPPQAREAVLLAHDSAPERAAPPCRTDSTAEEVIMEHLAMLVTVDSLADPAFGDMRARLSLPTVAADSLKPVRDTAVCQSALAAYRRQRFGADHGWLTNAFVVRIQSRYVVYAGELTPFGPILYVFDQDLRFIALH